MKNVTVGEMVHVLEGYKGHSFVSLETSTIPKLTKKGRDSGLTLKEKLDCFHIVKVSKFNAGIGYNYVSMIENRLDKEGKDKEEYKQGTSWHEPFENTNTIRQHKATKELYFYVALIANNPSSSFYLDERGNIVDKQDLVEFLPKPSAPKNQGLTDGNEILVRTLKLESLKKITMEKETYIVN